MKHLTHALLCILLVAGCVIDGVSQSRRGVKSLLVAACDSSESMCETQHLYRFSFKDGILVDEELLLTTKEEGIYLGGPVPIFSQRYLLISEDCVFDVKTKQKRCGVQNPIRTKLDEKRKLNKRTYYGTSSPNGKKVATSKFSNGDLWIVRTDGKLELLGSNFSSETKEISSAKPFTPFIWIDNERILTQEGNGRLVVVRVDKSVERLLDVPLKEPIGQADFFRNLKNEIIYRQGGESFVIDPAKRTYSEYLWHPLGHGFEVSETGSACGETVRFRGRDIGCIPIWNDETLTEDGYLATPEYRLREETAPNGEVLRTYARTSIKVWSKRANSWITIQKGWAANLIGWIGEM